MHFFISTCLNYGASIYQVQIKVSSFTGHERESCWYCFEAYLFRNQSATISPNMGFYLHCSPLCHHSNELSEQGNDPLFIAKFVICSDSCLSVVHVKLGYCLVCTSNYKLSGIHTRAHSPTHTHKILGFSTSYFLV